jgi:hypothetical protein
VDLDHQTSTLGVGELLLTARGEKQRPRTDGDVKLLVLSRSVTSMLEGGKPDPSLILC